MSRAAAKEALAAGDLSAAAAALIEAVRAAPGDAGLRAFLFELSCVTGQWDRAARALGVLGEIDAAALGMTADYLPAIEAERTREAVFAGRASPDVFGGGTAWTAELAEALRLEAAGEAQAAHDLRVRALEAAPADPGVLATVSDPAVRFDWLADADTRLGPVLEAVMNGAYRWIAFEDVGALDVEPPKDLRDAVWTVAVLTLRDGGQWPIMIPTRYPGTVETGDPGLMLGRRTEWRPLAGEHAAGLGQRLLAHPEGDAALLDLRRVAFDALSEAPEPAATDDPAG